MHKVLGVLVFLDDVVGAPIARCKDGSLLMVC